MTLDEAIEIIKAYKDRLTSSCSNQLTKDICAFDLAIKALEWNSQGEWVRKEDVIHRIAKQYSEHNELVPIWLSIGDMKGGEEE